MSRKSIDVADEVRVAAPRPAVGDPPTALARASAALMRFIVGTRVLGVLLIVALFIMWELIAKKIELASFPMATQVLETFVTDVKSGELPEVLVGTIRRMLFGYFLAAGCAIPIGILMGVSRLAYNLFEPVTELLRPIPSSALVPIALLFFGIADTEKIVVVAFSCFFPVLLNTYSGVRGVDPVLVQTARTLGVSRLRILSQVRVPAALPSIMTGLRISLAVALILEVLVEMVAGAEGIGFYTINAQQSFNVSRLYAGVLTMGIVGYLLNRLFIFIERRVIGWHLGYTQAG